MKLVTVSTLLLAATVYACGSTDIGSGPDNAAILAADNADAAPGSYDVSVPKLLSDAKIARYKAALPKIAVPRLQRVFEDANTLWYDHEVMPPSYQDSVAPDVTVGCRPNAEGPSLINIIPGGRQMFSDDGKTFNYPFGHTAGTDKSTNVYVVDFVSLPVVDGKLQPVAYWIVNGNRGGFGLVQWQWMFPKGTLFGEMIFVKDGSGNLYPAELRTRERWLSGWATNAYRPFPTASSLAEAIKAKRPQWQANAALKAAVEHLEGQGSLQAKKVGSKIYPGVFEQDGVIDTIPALGDDALVKELLTQTTFVSAYGDTWKTVGGQKTYAASTSASFGVTPNNYDAGLIEVRDESCQRCHKDAQHSIEDFNDNAVLYGDVWGSDQIFSWHPFDTQLCHGAAEDNRAVRPIFKSSGFVQKYDASVHRAEMYQKLK